MFSLVTYLVTLMFSLVFSGIYLVKQENNIVAPLKPKYRYVEQKKN